MRTFRINYDLQMNLESFLSWKRKNNQISKNGLNLYLYLMATHAWVGIGYQYMDENHCCFHKATTIANADDVALSKEERKKLYKNLKWLENHPNHIWLDASELESRKEGRFII